jgi:hypothetical protein
LNAPKTNISDATITKTKRSAMPSTAPGTGGVRHVAITQATASAAPRHARVRRLLARISQARLRITRIIFSPPPPVLRERAGGG